MKIPVGWKMIRDSSEFTAWIKPGSYLLTLDYHSNDNSWEVNLGDADEEVEVYYYNTFFNKDVALKKCLELMKHTPHEAI